MQDESVILFEGALFLYPLGLGGWASKSKLYVRL